jgi:hypothetical protein
LPQQQQMNLSCVCAAGAKKGAILSGLRQMRVLYLDDIGLGTWRCVLTAPSRCCYKKRRRYEKYVFIVKQ